METSQITEKYLAKLLNSQKIDYLCTQKEIIEHEYKRL